MTAVCPWPGCNKPGALCSRDRDRLKAMGISRDTTNPSAWPGLWEAHMAKWEHAMSADVIATLTRERDEARATLTSWRTAIVEAIGGAADQLDDVVGMAVNVIRTLREDLKVVDGWRATTVRERDTALARIRELEAHRPDPNDVTEEAHAVLDQHLGGYAVGIPLPQRIRELVTAKDEAVIRLRAELDAERARYSERASVAADYRDRLFHAWRTVDGTVDGVTYRHARLPGCAYDDLGGWVPLVRTMSKEHDNVVEAYEQIRKREVRSTDVIIDADKALDDAGAGMEGAELADRIRALASRSPSSMPERDRVVACDLVDVLESKMATLREQATCEDVTRERLDMQHRALFRALRAMIDTTPATPDRSER